MKQRSTLFIINIICIFVIIISIQRLVHFKTKNITISSEIRYLENKVSEQKKDLTLSKIHLSSLLSNTHYFKELYLDYYKTFNSTKKYKKINSNKIMKLEDAILFYSRNIHISKIKKSSNLN